MYVCLFVWCVYSLVPSMCVYVCVLEVELNPNTVFGTNNSFLRIFILCKYLKNYLSSGEKKTACAEVTRRP